MFGKWFEKFCGSLCELDDFVFGMKWFGDFVELEEGEEFVFLNLYDEDEEESCVL